MSSRQQLAFELQNVISRFKRSMSAHHSLSTLKGAEKHLLFLVHELNNGRLVTTSEIARKTGVTLAAVTHQVNAMEKRELLTRVMDKQDKRVSRIQLTKKGKSRILSLKKEFAKKTQLLVAFLGEKDSNDLIRLVKKLATFPCSKK